MKKTTQNAGSSAPLNAAMFRIAPQSERASYAPSEDLVFRLPASQVLQPGSVRLEFMFTTSVDFPFQEALTLPSFAGAQAVIRSLEIASPTLGGIDRLINYPAWVTALNACRYSFGNTMSSKGSRELIAPLPLTSRRLLQNSSTMPCFVSLELESDLLRQAVDLERFGGLTITIRLATAQQLFVRDLISTAQAVNPSYTISAAYLTGAFISGMAAPNPLTFMTVTTIQGTLRSGSDILSTYVEAPNCVAAFQTFTLKSNESSLAVGASDYMLSRLPNLSELAYRVGGISSPNSFRIDAVANGDDSEARTGALKAMAKTGFGEALCCSPSSALQCNTQIPCYVLGTLLGDAGVGVDLSKHQFSLDVRSGVVAAAPYLVNQHFVNMTSL